MKIPFFPNTPDGTHCFQAALAMVLGAFWPDRKFTYEELDVISAKVKDKWTWPTAAMLWLIAQGFELKLIEDFDYDAFAKQGGEYLIQKCGHEVGKAQIQNSVIDREQKYAGQFAKLNIVEKRLPDFNDIRDLLKSKYLLICNVNAASMNNQSGYSGHFVAVYECGNNTVELHDPGLPPRPFLKISRAMFEKGWAYPTKNEKNLLAIRLKQTK